MAGGGVRAGVAYAEIVPKISDGFAKDVERQVSGPVEESGKRVGGSLTKVAGLVGGAFAAKGIFDFGKASVEAATESAKITAQTEAVIKSTGAAAKVTAGQIGDLAAAISAKTGVDDEAIQQGQNLLLTFTNVRNEAGKGNDIFNQSTKTLVDMAAAMGTDVKSGAIQLGKALNDPAKGITALTRVGVTFTDQQKEQIRTMQAAGDMAGAQKIILAELNKEFGGSAEAQATAGDKLKVVMGNLQEEIGGRLLPVFEKFATFAAQALPEAFAVGERVFGRLQALLGPIVQRIADFFNQVRQGPDWMASLAVEIGKLFGWFEDDERIGTMIDVFHRLRDTFQTVVAFIADNLKPILIGLGIVIAALAAPVATVVAAVIYAYTQFETFRNIVNAVVDFLANTVAPAMANFAGFVVGQFQNLISWVQQYWPQISEAIGHVLNVVGGLIRTAIDVISTLWRQWGDDLIRFAQTAWDFIRGTIDNVLQVIRGIIQTVVALINGDWGKAWDGIKQILAGIWDQIVNLLRLGIEGLKNLLGGLASSAGDIFRSLADKIVDFLLSIPGRIANLGKDILSKLIPDIPGKGLIEGAIKNIPGFARGGVIPGPLNAPRLIIAHGGEEITPNGPGAAAAGSGPLVGQMVFNAASMGPDDVVASLSWLQRTWGR